MPIKLPNLDDRTFADLVAEAHTLIPVHAPEWTNHNESDPGITLVELFAYLTEMQIYRLNRVTDANLCAFLRLIDGAERKPSKQTRGMITRVPDTTEVALRDEVRDVVLKLREQDRAVTCEDFERLALAADQKVSRASCVPRRDLTAEKPYEIANAHVSVVVVPIEAQFESVFLFGGVQGSSPLKVADVVNAVSLCSQLKDEKNMLAAYLRSQFGSVTAQLLEQYTPSQQPAEALIKALVKDLNDRLKDPSLYEPKRFAPVKLRPEAQSLLGQPLQSEELLHLNRLLLEDAYPLAISRRENFTDVTGAVAMAGTKMVLLPQTTANPRIYIGSTTIFDSLRFSLSETGAGYALAFKYFDGKRNEWVDLTKKDHALADNTSNWTLGGLVTFTPPADWKRIDLNGASRYWICISTSKPQGTVAEADRIDRDLKETVQRYLEPRRLLTTRVHVVGPRFVTIGVHVSLSLKPDGVTENVKEAVQNKLKQFFNPLSDLQGHEGWPFGRNVYVSEIYQLLDRIPGVDFITKVSGTDIVTLHSVTKFDGTEIVETRDVRDKRRLLQDTELVAIKLNPDELVKFSLENSDIVPVPPTARKLET